MAMDVYEQIAERLHKGRATVVLTLVRVEGSAPRGPGAKMVVGRQGIVAGTLGGGAFEQQMVARAHEIMASGEAALFQYEDQTGGGLACGGRYTVFAEPLLAPKRLFILGSGHVGTALARLAENCGYLVLVFDDRPCPTDATGRYIQLDAYENPFADHLPRKGDSLVIAGRSHGVDLKALRAALKAPFSFIGLLGSSRKKKNFFKTLAGEGISEETLSRVYTPVGLDIGARTPDEIAVAIMAQLIDHNRQKQSA
jgi:xanthine dehydrogenase accessory factor